MRHDPDDFDMFINPEELQDDNPIEENWFDDFERNDEDEEYYDDEVWLG